MSLINSKKLVLGGLLGFWFFLPLVALAAPSNYVLLEPTLVRQTGDNVQVGGLTTQNGSTGFAAYFQLLYQMLMGVGVVTVIFYFVWGGFRIMVSTVPGVKQAGMADIYRSLEGLAFLLGAYLILNTINPRFTHINIGLIQINSAATNDNILSLGNNNVYDPPPTIANICSDSNKTTGSYIIANENWSNSQYTDSEGFPTIGVGHKIEPGESFNSPLSDAEVAELFQADYSKHYNQARAAAQNNGINFDSLTPRRQAVIIDMTFNLGAMGDGGLNEFKNMWSAMQAGDWNKAGDEILDSTYARQVGGRARRNADTMRTDNEAYINQQINSNSRAKTYCQ